MPEAIIPLLYTAVTIGVLHTLLGPDHYLPFVVLSKAKKWNISKTLWITFLCGLGHVLGSVTIGTIGIVGGVGLSKLEAIEGLRGDWAAWCLFVFGLLYAIWGLIRAAKNKHHQHIHVHKDGTFHSHPHETDDNHTHPKKVLSPWVLFIIFVLGPCEALIPMLLYPAAKHSAIGIVAITITFTISTLVTMLTTVFFLAKGIQFIKLGKLERFSHAIAGFTIACSAAGILFFNL